MDYNYGDNILRRGFFTVAILWAFTPGVVARFTPYAKAVSLDSVPSLVFQKWKLTNYRRNEPIYQLKCLSGCEFEADWVKCFNVHSPMDKGPAWRCQADLPSHLQFSTLEVICEGYESKDDKSILEGSCGLEYSLKHVALPSNDMRASKSSSTEVSETERESQWGSCQWLMLTIVIYGCCYCLYQVVQSDLKEALNNTHQKTSVCGKCQSTRFSLPDPLKEKYPSELQGWQSGTPSEFRKSNEEEISPRVGPIFPACRSRMRESYQSPPRSPRSPREAFLRSLRDLPVVAETKIWTAQEHEETRYC